MDLWTDEESKYYFYKYWPYSPHIGYRVAISCHFSLTNYFLVMVFLFLGFLLLNKTTILWDTGYIIFPYCHFPHDNRTVNTRKCVGITAFRWWTAANNAFSQRKQLQTLENIVFQFVNQPVNVGRHLVFKRYLRIYCPRKWKKTHCLQRKTSVKTMFCYWENTSKQWNTNCFPVC